MPNQKAKDWSEEDEIRRIRKNLGVMALMLVIKPSEEWWNFRQNNSGGYFTAPGIAVFVRAATGAEAERKLNDADDFTSEFCDCCGERWSNADKVSHLEVVNLIKHEVEAKPSYSHLKYATKHVPVVKLIY